MKIVLNTRSSDAGSQVCIFQLHRRLLKAGFQAKLNDWNNYSSYEIAIFMAYDHEMEKAKEQNNDIKIILADPKLTSKKLINDAINADMLLVSSVEQRDSLLRINANCHIHYMFPIFHKLDKTHQKQDDINIAYHGNRVHIDAMKFLIGDALLTLSKFKKIKLCLIYNIEKLGLADFTFFEEKGLSVEHIQWSPETIVTELNKADIGILPNELPIDNKATALRTLSTNASDCAFEPFDHLLRFKISTNPGRLSPYVYAGLPVVSDFSPSASQFIKDGESGFIVSGSAGWCFALAKLASNPSLREKLSTNLALNVETEIENQIDKLKTEIEKLSHENTIVFSDWPSVFDEQMRYDNYPRPQENLFRWCRRQLRRFTRYL